MPNYDFHSPSKLTDRVQNLIAWWRHQSDDGGDEGSISIMADQLERVLRGPIIPGIDVEWPYERSPDDGYVDQVIGVKLSDD